jgi:hypothetical protein
MITIKYKIPFHGNKQVHASRNDVEILIELLKQNFILNKKFSINDLMKNDYLAETLIIGAYIK